MEFDRELRAHFYVTFDDGLCHALGDYHGGVISALVDNAIWFTAAARYPGVWIATSEFHTYIVGAPGRRNLHSQGWLIHAGKRTAVAKAQVETDDGRLVAVGMGTLVVLPHVKLSLEEVLERWKK